MGGGKGGEWEGVKGRGTGEGGYGREERAKSRRMGVREREHEFGGEEVQ